MTIPYCGNCDIDRGRCPRYNDTLEQLPCINHPQARDYLMKDVIEELNQWGKEAEELNRTDECSAYVEAINLIKNGVK